LVLRLDFTSLRNARRTLDQLEQTGINREQVRLVINRYGQPKQLAISAAEQALGLKTFHFIPDDPKTINQATNAAIPAALNYPKAGVSKSITGLARSLNGRHSPCPAPAPRTSRNFLRFFGWTDAAGTPK